LAITTISASSSPSAMPNCAARTPSALVEAFEDWLVVADLASLALRLRPLR
jgi:hypothetical protein